jgi:tRNA nucleotidyltransferase (CCA-adding enzyme)
MVSIKMKPSNKGARMTMGGTLLTERSFAEIIAANGGRVFRVGGCVRDQFMGSEPKDIDLCVVGMVRKNFKMLFPDAEECGNNFPVFRLLIDGVKCEVAFARTERKVGSGYNGFKVASNPKITIEEDLYRRDLTVNAIAVDSLSGEMIDPYHGIQDIKERILRATSPHFAEDPVRALRLAGLSSRLGFAIDEDTLAMARTVARELASEPIERILAELTKVLGQAQEPARFFKALAAMNLLEVTFTEISELSIEELHTAMVNLDAVAKVTQNPKLRFAVWGIVLDKERLSCWNNRMTLPGVWLDAAVAVNQISALLKDPSPENIVAAIYQLKRGSLQIEEFDIVARAVDLHLPALASLKAKMNMLVEEAPPKALKGKELGEWLRRKHVDAVREWMKTQQM